MMTQVGTLQSQPATVARALSMWRVVMRTLQFFRLSMLLVAMGVAAATAVIVGALLVGDSVRGSLRFLAIDKLGRIEHVLLAPRFMTAATVERWAEQPGYPTNLARPVPAMLFPNGTAEATNSEMTHRAGSITVLGIPPNFWELDDSQPSVLPTGREVILNEGLARELGVTVNDQVTLRLPIEQAVPSDSPLGKKDEGLIESLPRLKVVGILPNRGLGRFDIRTSQKPPQNAYVPLELLQETLLRAGQVNAVFFPNTRARPDGNRGDMAAAQDEVQTLSHTMSPSLQDFGLRLERVRRVFPDAAAGEETPADTKIQTIYDYYHLTCDQLLIPPALAQIATNSFANTDITPVITYLANKIERVDDQRDLNRGNAEGQTVVDKVLYSTISGIDPSATFPIPAGVVDHRLAEDEVVVNNWLAHRMGLTVGEALKISYYLPENFQGKEQERSFIARVAGIAPLTEPDRPAVRNRPAHYAQAPTLFNDPNLTPEVPGITDQASIEDWQTPFPLEPGTTPEDDRYFRNHRLTPKLFISLETGQKLFGSRFGQISSLRIDPAVAVDEASLAKKIVGVLETRIAETGLQPIPLRAQHLSAARGTTPFDMLFLSLSFFVIVAAVLLIALLFRLGIEQRTAQWGLLLAAGWTKAQVRRLLLREGILLAAVGSTLGVFLGIGYAYWMMWGLKSWWVGAVAVPFLDFYVGRGSLVIGWVIGIVMAWLTIAIAARALNREPARRLLQGRMDIERKRGESRGWISLMVLSAILLAAVGVALIGWRLSGEARAGAFVGSGMLFLIGLLIGAYRWLTVRPHSKATVPGSFGLAHFAKTSMQRKPTRSILSLGLIAVASFLILAMSLFQATPDRKGVGGFAWQAQSSQPIARDLNDPSYRKLVLGENTQLDDCQIVSFRLRPGDDASCNNLYQANQPRVLGVPEMLGRLDEEGSDEDRFPWSGVDKARLQQSTDSPWTLLAAKAAGTQDDPLPVILDQNTALWSLHLSGTVGEIFSYEFDRQIIYFRTVGLLQNTVLQGSLMIGEANFTKVFPELSGYRFFLIRERLFGISGNAGRIQNLPKMSSKTSSPSERNAPSGSTVSATSSSTALTPNATASNVSASAATTPLKDDVVAALEKGWSDEGLDVVDTRMVLAQLLAVQNTYLRAFQTLGALGLLLGTFGLAVVQVRSVVERKSELALLRAVGFTSTRLGWLQMYDNLMLLGGGISIGIVATLLAVLPLWVSGHTLSHFGQPVVMILIIFLVGIAAGMFAIRTAMRLPLLESLRGK